MNKYLLITALTGTLFVAANTYAKDSLIDLDNASVGAFGGPIFKFSQILDQDSYEIGAMGGATFTTGQHSVMIGAGGFGLVNEVDEDDKDIDMGYAGLVMGYTYSPQSVVHIDSRLLLGAGGIEEKNSSGSDDDESGTFLIAEISSQLDVNVTDFFEIGVGGSYRTVSEPSRVSVEADDLSGPSVFISLQFGQL